RAPAVSALWISISVSYVVSTMIRALGNSVRIEIMVSMPLMSGSLRSIRVTSGLFLRKYSIASRPVETWATTFISGCLSITLALPSRTSGWSSTLKTRILFRSFMLTLASGAFTQYPLANVKGTVQKLCACAFTLPQEADGVHVHEANLLQIQ